MRFCENSINISTAANSTGAVSKEIYAVKLADIQVADDALGI